MRDDNTDRERALLERMGRDEWFEPFPDEDDPWDAQDFSQEVNRDG
jgi:hypothetical protein